MRSRSLVVKVLWALALSSCSSKVEVLLPFVGVDQDQPAAHAFVSHKASAEVWVDGVQKPVSAYTWRVRDNTGAELPVNAQADRAEWVPEKEGRFEVSVRMSYDNGTPADPADDKAVTETRDVEVQRTAPPVTALWEGTQVTLALPVASSPLARTWAVSRSTPGSAATQEVLPSSMDSELVLPLPTDVAGLGYTVTASTPDGTIYGTWSAAALPRLAHVEVWSGTGAQAVRLDPDPCARRGWGFPSLKDAPVSHLELRNTGQVGVAYQFREGWASGTVYVPGAQQNTVGGFVAGTLAPGGVVDITGFQVGVMGILGSPRPFSAGSAFTDEGVIPWPPGAFSWTQDGQQVSVPASELHVAEITWAACSDTDPTPVWK